MEWIQELASKRRHNLFPTLLYSVTELDLLDNKDGTFRAFTYFQFKHLIIDIFAHRYCYDVARHHVHEFSRNVNDLCLLSGILDFLRPLLKSLPDNIFLDFQHLYEFVLVECVCACLSFLLPNRIITGKEKRVSQESFHHLLYFAALICKMIEFRVNVTHYVRIAYLQTCLADKVEAYNWISVSFKAFFSVLLCY